jgi:hypothetical protein
MRAMFRLPSNWILGLVTVLLWWPVAFSLAMFYWLTVGWWWWLLVASTGGHRRYRVTFR